MSRLIETIKLEDGTFYNLAYHEARMSKALSSLFGIHNTTDLPRILEEQMYPTKGLYKCRVIYDDATCNVNFEPYQIRKVRRVKVIRDETISYHFKFEDRRDLNRLFALRGDCDDIVIIKAGKVTDCSYANIVFRKGSQWFTPDTPLLSGTMRQKMLDDNKIHAKEIRDEDIRSYETFKLINAMLEFQSPEIEVSQIVF